MLPPKKQQPKVAAFLSKPTQEALYVITVLAQCMSLRRSRVWHHGETVYQISTFRRLDDIQPFVLITYRLRGLHTLALQVITCNATR